ncbi:A/G-specific adenine glycosylase [Inmirania thermothiophila]|uniref:Adenine DNA glycosylase n=1 Tax=Inmirania thermothiophila TaxID=1750597 RepID=A0A3N1Y7Z6_9GAMM|nr:A/G-specific adenine glycosylase [Inmirania thermothiophila]ROR34631.1 A/G-specific DNA-adenine glycosylase [Inmirania thermothiophila]
MRGAFAAAVIDWQRRAGRHDLPWQRPRTPYRVWVSEVMLQQTRAETVIPYFARFTARWPDVPALAAAGREEVLAAWSGLGYYRRAIHLHEAARRIVERHGGALPRDLEALAALPGIGRSTAGAILALAWGEPAPILDGNVRRLLARWHAVEGWPGRAAVACRLWALAEGHLPRRDVAAYTQGLMDLGATVCTPRRPACAACPVAFGCEARRRGDPCAYPAPAPRRRRPRRRTRMLVLRRGDGRVLLARRPPAGVWPGLWSLPECAPGDDPEAWCRVHLGFAARTEAVLPTVRHAFTHFELEIEPLLLTVEGAAAVGEGQVCWVGGEETQGLALPAPVRAILGRIGA